MDDSGGSICVDIYLYLCICVFVYLYILYLLPRVGEGGGSIHCRASSGEPTLEAPEIQCKVEDFFDDCVAEILMKGVADH